MSTSCVDEHVLMSASCAGVLSGCGKRSQVWEEFSGSGTPLTTPCNGRPVFGKVALPLASVRGRLVE